MGLLEQWLMVGITAAKRLEADGLIGQIDRTPNQAMGPPRIDVKESDPVGGSLPAGYSFGFGDPRISIKLAVSVYSLDHVAEFSKFLPQ